MFHVNKNENVRNNKSQKGNFLFVMMKLKKIAGWNIQRNKIKCPSRKAKKIFYIHKWNITSFLEEEKNFNFLSRDSCHYEYPLIALLRNVDKMFHTLFIVISHTNILYEEKFKSAVRYFTRNNL